MSVFAFGEILWDVYPEKKSLGGAPFNFAAHLSRLGNVPYFISAVGKDELAKKTLEAVNQFEVNKDLLCQIDKPTGVCQVTISEDGIPTYNLCPDMAYDNITLTDAHKEIIKKDTNPSLYFGSLVQRNHVSAGTLKELIEDYKWDNIFFDINIRQNYYSKEIAEDGFNACTVLKISREELPVINELGICSYKERDFESRRDFYHYVCKFLADKYNISTILLTLDKDGAMSYSKDTGKSIFSYKPDCQVVSTVGAGDSFFAAYTSAYIKGDTPEVCLEKAVALSSFVVQRLESIPEYPQELLEKLIR